MELSKQNIREREFHDKLQSSSKGRFENVFYKALYNASTDFFNQIKSNCKEKIVLDFGCGIGEASRKVYDYKPKKLSGIDISEVSVKKASNEAKRLRMNIEYKVDNCEHLELKDDSYDLVYGTGIIHHLNTEKCINEISRILKDNGTIVFLEPLGTNPIINFYRKITPKARSHDEHPLIKKDFDIIKQKFKIFELKYYGFLTLILFLIYRDPSKSKVFKLLSVIDQVLFKLKVFQLLAWSVVITAKKS
tara:strand:- start:659 stop:1402 length:744 start_codon:yes stop_codon:yes gene_type:complete